MSAFQRVQIPRSLLLNKRPFSTSEGQSITTLGLRREPLKRCSQMSGRSICMAGGCVRGRSRDPSGHRRTHCASMSRGDAVPQERAAPLLVPVPHRRASRFAIASSKFRRELSRALLCRQLYLCFVTFSGSVQCSKLSFIVCCHDLMHWDYCCCRRAA